MIEEMIDLSGDIVVEKRRPSDWQPDTNKGNLALLGKLAEEAAELAQASARAIIQGIDEREPVTKKPNRRAIEDEIADVLALIELAAGRFGLDSAYVAQRGTEKLEYHKAWLDNLDG